MICFTSGGHDNVVAYDSETKQVICESIGFMCGDLLVDYVLLNQAKFMSMFEVVNSKQHFNAVIVYASMMASLEIKSILGKDK